MADIIITIYVVIAFVIGIAIAFLDKHHHWCIEEIASASVFWPVFIAVCLFVFITMLIQDWWDCRQYEKEERKKEHKDD